MVAAMVRGVCAQSGVRPFDPYRDLKPVAELIATAFRDILGPDGDIALAEMRRVARWHSLLWWLYWPDSSGTEIMSGFVWVEQGRVVGNVSLRRAREWGGFFIGNVAVHPDWQGRGIAGALMKAALEAIEARGGRWVGLEVRADNQVAGRLYGQLGFQEVGRTRHLLRPAGALLSVSLPPYPPARRGRGRDSAALVELVYALVPQPHRVLLEIRQEDYRPNWERSLDRWLEGRRETWWVLEEHGLLRGAVRTLHERGRRPDRFELLMVPSGDERLATLLVQQGLASLGSAAKKMVETTLPGPGEPLVAALEAVGFQTLRVLVQMRLDLGQRIPVKGQATRRP